jgi:TonB family protein
MRTANQCGKLERMSRVLRCGLAVAVCLAFGVVHVRAAETSLETSLKSVWVGKNFILRTPDAAREIDFDAQGTRVGAPQPGPWYENTSLRVTKVKVSGSTLELRGQRRAIVFDPPTGHFAQAPLDRDVKVRFTFDKPPSEITDVLPVIDKTFLTGDEGFGPLLPDYWSACVQKTRFDLEKRRWYCGDKQMELHKLQQASENPAVPDLPSDEAGKKVYRVGGAVSPPRALVTPDPAYSAVAKAAKYQGTTILWLIIDKNGKPNDIKIASPAGMGLDDKAVETVQGWRFRPAKKNGVPVAVQVNVEVNFRLY